jgi:hypothetical protein
MSSRAKRDFDFGLDPIHNAVGTKKNRKGIGVFSIAAASCACQLPCFKVVLVRQT